MAWLKGHETKKGYGKSGERKATAKATRRWWREQAIAEGETEVATPRAPSPSARSTEPGSNAERGDG